MRLFIVRPFGIQDGIDFNRVESELIFEAVTRLRSQYGLELLGSTTLEITRQGNIREDMFRLLVTSDLVIADVSIHNANVFYELGIRHGLRERHTFLIRSDTTNDKYPFDLQTDRYLVYEGKEPKASVDRLVNGLRATLVSDEKDSPVFKLLPRLAQADRAVLMPVPLDFQEEVERAGLADQRGDLRLLAFEAQSFEWAPEGLRLIGEAQFNLKAYPGACATYEALRKDVPDDLDANLKLGTIYQKLATDNEEEIDIDLLTRSDQAIGRALAVACTSPQRAEIHSLLGSNAKTLWVRDWRAAELEERRRKALESPYLERALDEYLSALKEDVGYYPAINALALLTVQVSLAQEYPSIWRASFESDADADRALERQRRCMDHLAGALTLVLGMDEVMGKRTADVSRWEAITRADLLLLTSSRPPRVAREYRDALAMADRFAIGAADRNIEIFRSLKLLEANVDAALQEIEVASARAGAGTAVERAARVILFTGHMVDKPDTSRDNQRFPRTVEAERRARQMIEDAVSAEVKRPGGVSLGIAGGACGADILFHEICADLGIATRLYLALPQDGFQVSSVQRGGPQWVERYRQLCDRVPSRVLQDTESLPHWLTGKPNYDVWQRCNLWMMFNALAVNARESTLVALYNRQRDAEGPGGTGHLVEHADHAGFKTVELDAKRLLEP
jgi:hypothetical protein